MASTKRKRGPATVYRESVPHDDGYGTVFEQEVSVRRVRSSLVPTYGTRSQTDTWSTATTWGPPDDVHFALDADGDLYDMAVDADVMDEGPTGGEKVSKKSRVSRRPHVVWMEQYRETYLLEMIRWSGRGDFRTAKQCPDCLARQVENPGDPRFRCLECALPDLVCKSCCVRRHKMHPLHWIQEWDQSLFIRRSLKSLGLRYQLGHASMYCANATPCHADMLVLHTNGIHSVAIDYCNCSHAQPPHIQLLRRQLYPASQLLVKTCATFSLLRQLHKLALATKASTYDFYRALEQLTDNTGLDCPKSRYRALFRMILQWRHLKMLKWGGRGHDETGARGTRPGELAILCPSCPRPGINLPEGWDRAPESMRFLYMAIICMDANFRLKNNLVSNYSQDPGLGIGWAYMVERKPYEKYVLSRTNDQDISTCVGLRALLQANTRNSEGQRYTGTGAGICGRSEMILPLGVGNLHKGERYSNMDFVFGSSIQQFLVPIILISYDIACQWFINLFKRIDTHWPEEIKPRPGTKLIPAIPKLHEPMHQTANHQVYSLNYIPGVGLSDCECPERVWGPHNILGNSTKMQGPGSRQDVLDDHFGFWNWCKYIGQGATLLRRYKSAVADRNIQREGHRGLTEALDKESVAEWEKMCLEWEQDDLPKTKKNPYESDGITISESQVRKELAEEEKDRVEQGGVSLHVTSASAFIIHGIELEDAQRRLRRLAKKTPGSATVRQESTLTEQRNILRARIKAWDQLCPIYMPGLLQYQTTTLQNNPSSHQNSAPPSSFPQSDNPEDCPLWVPSKILAEHRSAVCRQGLAEIEARLRTAQCQDALEGVRNILKMKTRMIAFKNRNIRGQRQGTRSRAVIDRVHERARSTAEKYRASRVAKLELEGSGVWEETLRELKDEDIRGYQDSNRLRVRQDRRGVLEDEAVEAMRHDEAMDVDDDNILLLPQTRTRRDGTGETRRTLSWIWTTARVGNTNDAQDDILRTEWAKSRARATRTWEEVLRLKEEMRRVLESLEWKARWWMDRSKDVRDVGKDVQEGLVSYAQRQSSMQKALAAKFRELWQSPLKDATEGLEGVQVEDKVGGEVIDEDDEGESETEDGCGVGGFDEDDDDS